MASVDTRCAAAFSLLPHAKVLELADISAEQLVSKIHQKCDKKFIDRCQFMKICCAGLLLDALVSGTMFSSA